MTGSFSSLINNIVQNENDESNNCSHSETNAIECHVLKKYGNKFLNTGVISQVIWFVGEDGDGISGVTDLPFLIGIWFELCLDLFFVNKLCNV